MIKVSRHSWIPDHVWERLLAAGEAFDAALTRGEDKDSEAREYIRALYAFRAARNQRPPASVADKRIWDEEDAEIAAEDSRIVSLCNGALVMED